MQVYVGFEEIENLLMKFNAEDALTLINQLPEESRLYANVYKAEALNLLGQYENALNLCNSNLEEEFISNKILFLTNLIKSYVFFRIGEDSKSEETFFIAEDIYSSLSSEEQEQNQIWYGILKHLKGNLRNIRGDPQSGINCYMEAINIFQGVKRQTRASTSIMNVGLLYTYLGELDKGLEYLNKAKKILFNHSSYHINFHLSFQFAMNYFYRGEMETSLDYMNIALEDGRNLNNVHFQFTTLSVLAYIHIDLEKREKAKKYIDELTEINHDLNSDKKQKSTDYITAYFLKSSTRMKDHSKAQLLLEPIVYEDSLNVGLVNAATLALIEILIQELKTYQDEDVLNEIMHLLSRLEESSKLYNDFMSQISTLLIKSKLSLIQGKIQQSSELLEEADEIALSNNIHYYTNKIENEKKKLEEDLNNWQKLIDDGATIKQKLDLISYQEYIETAKRYAQRT